MKLHHFVRDLFMRFPLLLPLTIILLISLNLFGACSLFSLSPIVDFIAHPDLQGVSPLTSKIINIMIMFRLPASLEMWLIIFFGFVFLSSVFQIMAYYCVSCIRYSILRRIVYETFDDFLSARWNFFTDEKQGVLLNTFTREFNVFSEAFRAAAEFFSTVLQIGISLTIPFYISWQTTCVSLGVVMIFSIPFVLFNKHSYNLGRMNTSNANDLLSVMHENLGMAKLLLGFGNQRETLEKIDRIFARYSEGEILVQTIMISVHLLYRPLAAFALIVSLVTARFFKVPLAETVVLIAALFQFATYVGKLTAKYNLLSNALPSYEQIEGLRKRARKLRHPTGGKKFDGFSEEIRIHNLTFSYPNEQFTLKGINMHIPKGAMIAVVGKSGAGKSTLMDIIMNFYSPTSGVVLIDKSALQDYDVISYRRRIGYVPQESSVFNMSIRDNLLWAFPNASDAQMESACRIAFADEFIEQLPEGYNTLVGDRGVRLSGGQVQRISLARAFLRKPEVLILDEATSALDTHSERCIQKAIENFSKEATVIAVAHRLSTIKRANCIYVLDQGRVVEQGVYEDLLRDAGTFNSMVQLQELQVAL